MKKPAFFVFVIAIAACAPNRAAVSLGPVADAKATVAPQDLGMLAWRRVGPPIVGGRLDAVSEVDRVGFDRAVPYHIMGELQDHEVWWGPNTVWNGAGGATWRDITAWGGGHYAKPDPTNDAVIYESTGYGDLARLDVRTGELQSISPQPDVTFAEGGQSQAYRFNRDAPLLVSHHTPMVLFAANVLLRTYDGGNTWSLASPDLTQPCETNANAESDCTLYSLAEEANGTIWAGSDNGHLNRSPDGGSSWHDVIGNVKGLPPLARVDGIDAGKDAVFVTFDRHLRNDTRPYVYETTDNGATWQNISANLPSWAYVIRQDTRAPSLLFAGTNDGIWASFDRGGHWIDLRQGMQREPFYDLQIQPDANDLIAGTGGRSFAILDDLVALEALADASQTQVSLFDASDAYRYITHPSRPRGQHAFISDNKPYGSVISYYLKPNSTLANENETASSQKVDLQILDGKTLIRTIAATSVAGINRVTWDLTTDAPGGSADQNVAGPEVVPGTYTVRLKARGQTLTVPVTVKIDPSLRVSHADLQAQYNAVARLATMQERCETWSATLTNDATKLAKTNAALSKELIAAADRLRLVDRIDHLRSLLATSPTAPTRAQNLLIDSYTSELDDVGRDIEPLLVRAAPLLPTPTGSPRPEARPSPS